MERAARAPRGLLGPARSRSGEPTGSRPASPIRPNPP